MGSSIKSDNSSYSQINSRKESLPLHTAMQVGVY